jgi:hypothetical protein
MSPSLQNWLLVHIEGFMKTLTPLETRLFYIGPQIVCVCMYVCMLWNVRGVCIGKLQEYTQFGSVKGFFCWWSFVQKKKN